MKKKSNKKRKPLPKFIKFMLILINVITLIFLVMTFFLNVLPMKFFIPIAIVLIIFDYLTSLLLIKRNKKKRITGLILSLVLLIIYGIGIFYEIKTNSFLDVITKNGNKVVENYMVIVNKDSSYKDIKDIKDNPLGIMDIDETGYKKAIEVLDKTVKTDKKTYNDSYSVTDALFANDKLEQTIRDKEELRIKTEQEQKDKQNVKKRRKKMRY